MLITPFFVFDGRDQQGGKATEQAKCKKKSADALAEIQAGNPV
jgi:hypothetical protein